MLQQQSRKQLWNLCVKSHTTAQSSLPLFHLPPPQPQLQQQKAFYSSSKRNDATHKPSSSSSSPTSTFSSSQPKRLSMIRVGINGASIAGLTTALTMKYHNANSNYSSLRIYTHLHTSQSVNNNYEYQAQGAILTHAAMDIYHKLGVGKAIEKQGRVMNEHIVRSFRGDSDLVRVNLQPAIAIKKSVLMNILTDALKTSQSNSKDSGSNNDSNSSNSSKVTMSTKSMHNLKRNEHGRFEASLQANFSKTFYDVIVGAEDSCMESVVKESFFADVLQNEKEAFSGVETVMGIIPKPTHLDTADKIVEWWGMKGRLGCFLINDRHLCVYSSFATQDSGSGKTLVGVSAFKQMLMASKGYTSKGTRLILDSVEMFSDEMITKQYKPQETILRAISSVKRGYQLKNPTDGKNVVLIGEAGYALNDAMFLSSTIDTLNGFELGRQLQQCDPLRGPQEAINIYVAKSQKLIEMFESEASRYNSGYSTGLPIFMRNLRLKSHKAVGSGPGSAVTNSHNISTL